MATDTPKNPPQHFSDVQQAAILALAQQPDYRFIGTEARVALTLVHRGIFKQSHRRGLQYELTQRGQEVRMTIGGSGE